MIRSIRTYSYLFGFLPFTLPTLRKLKKRQEGSEMIHRIPVHWASGILKRAGCTVEMNTEIAVPEGPVLFISNHEGNFDIPVLITTLPKPFGFISKVEVKKLPIIRSWMDEMNCVFLDRSDRRSAMKVLDDARDKLEAGHSMLIFPEGTRSKGEGIQSFKSGFAKIAQEADVPIVPIAIKGTSTIMEDNNNRIRPATVTVSILAPISQEEIRLMSRKELTMSVENIIQREIEKLTS